MELGVIQSTEQDCAKDSSSCPVYIHIAKSRKLNIGKKERKGKTKGRTGGSPYKLMVALAPKRKQTNKQRDGPGGDSGYRRFKASRTV